MHRRRAIREAIVTLVTGLPITGSNVSEGRTYPVDLGGMPALDVTTTDDVRTELVMSLPDEVRLLTVEITVRTDGDSYIGILDDVALEVEQVLGANRDLSGLVDEFRLMGTSLERTNEVGETPIGQLTLEYEATYSVASIDPQ